MDICVGTCEDLSNAVNCPVALAIGRPGAGTTNNNDPDPPDNFPNLGADESVDFDLMAGDDEANSGLGSDTVLGGEGDDIISDHAGSDILKGQEGSDVLISRHGGDTLYGGGAYNTYAACTDDDGEDANTETCAVAIMSVEDCGLTDTADFVAADECCMCGGGDGDPGAPTAEDAEENEGDCDTYVIYPTHEKAHKFDWTPVNYNVGAGVFTCTKIVGMRLTDMIEFRLDDPFYEDYKYTDLDDTCALHVDGWELNWYLGDQISPPDDDGVQPFTVGDSVLDIWFSRKTQMAHICLNTDMDHYFDKCDGGPDGEVSNDYCLAYWV